MVSLTPTPKQQIYGSDGNPLVGGKIYTYAAGTTTPLATYTDAGAGTANTNPIILNSLGQANIWLTPASSYKFMVYTSTDVPLYTVDNITAPIDYLSLVTSLASPPPIGSAAPNTGAFTTLAATTGNITTVNSTTVNAATITATGTITAETLTFEGGGSMTRPSELGIQPISASIAANALTITLNPTTLDFRSTTLSSGAVTTVTLSTAATLVVPYTATLGTVSGVQSQLIVVAINNAGTIELAVINAANSSNLNESSTINTAAISTTASSSNDFYSTAQRLGVAYRIVGYVESTQATAGTWATAPSTVQGHGGQALAVLGSFGFGQRYDSQAKTNGVTYYNTTGKPIVVNVLAPISTQTWLVMTVALSGATSSFSGPINTGATGTAQIYGVIPVGASYSLASNGGTISSITAWQEMR